MRSVNVFRSMIAASGILLLLAIGSARAAEQRREDLGVIPTPQEVTWIEASPNELLRIDGATRILLSAAATDGAKFAASNLQERVRQLTGLKLEITRDPKAVTAPKLIAIGNPK